MKIIHIVIGKFNPNRLENVNNVVYQLASQQAKTGKTIQVWEITRTPESNLFTQNFTTLLFQSEKFPFFVNNELKQAILQNKDAVYHLHGGWIPLFSSLAKIFSKHKIKFVLTPHGAYNEGGLRQQFFGKKMYLYFFEKNILKRVHKVYSTGKNEVESIQKLCPKVKVCLLPYGFEQKLYVQYSVKNNDFTIGYVGRLDSHAKGLDLLLEANMMFQNKYPSSKLWIVGEGKGRSWLENFTIKNNLKNVIFWGKKFGIDKDKLMSSMHILAHPSRNEGQSTSILEAASSGVPSIVSHDSNVAKNVTEYNAGIAVQNDNANQLASVMDEIYTAYTDNQAIKYITGAKRMLDQIFSWPVLVEKYDELYE